MSWLYSNRKSSGSDDTTTTEESNPYIHKEGPGDWVITQKGTGIVLSHHDSKEKAEAAFRAMEANKHG